jgi:hypothetical protein
MLAALPRDADGLGRRERELALAPAFDVLLQLLPVLKALGSPQGALQACSGLPEPASLNLATVFLCPVVGQAAAYNMAACCRAQPISLAHDLC